MEVSQLLSESNTFDLVGEALFVSELALHEFLENAPKHYARFVLDMALIGYETDGKDDDDLFADALCLTGLHMDDFLDRASRYYALVLITSEVHEVLTVDRTKGLQAAKGTFIKGFLEYFNE